MNAERCTACAARVSGRGLPAVDLGQAVVELPGGVTEAGIDALIDWMLTEGRRRGGKGGLKVAAEHLESGLFR